MYEEDRQLALSMYSDAFDSCEDLQGLIASLVSPTRQAVIIARAYNAKERKLQIHAQSRPDDGDITESDEIPGFILAIEDILPELLYDAPEAEQEGQISLFEEQEPEAEPVPEKEEAMPEALSPQENVSQEQEIIDAPAEEIPEPLEESPEELSSVAEDTPEEEPESVSDTPSEDEKSQEEEEISESPADDEAIEEKEEAEVPEEAAAPEAENEASEDEDDIDSDDEDDEADKEDEDDEKDEPSQSRLYSEPVYKANIALLILYVIFALPIGLAGIVVLLVPTLFFLSLAIVSIYAGCAVLVATFSGFAVFADIMVMLGIALIVLALGLLFLWLFIWFIGGAMSSMVRGIISLGHKWCYKEVKNS